MTGRAADNAAVLRGRDTFEVHPLGRAERADLDPGVRRCRRTGPGGGEPALVAWACRRWALAIAGGWPGWPKNVASPAKEARKLMSRQPELLMPSPAGMAQPPGPSSLRA